MSVGKIGVESRFYTNGQGNRVCELPTVKGGEKIKLVFSENEKRITAILLQKNERQVALKQEFFPKELSAIQNSAVFESFFKGAYAQVYPREGARFFIHQRGPGGGDEDIATEALALIEEGSLKVESRLKTVQKEGILFVGRVGAGKSTLINLVSDRSVYGHAFGVSDIRFEVTDPVVTISHSNTEAGTKFPEISTPPGQKYSYIDFLQDHDSHAAFMEVDYAPLVVLISKMNESSFQALLDKINCQFMGSAVLRKVGETYQINQQILTISGEEFQTDYADELLEKFATQFKIFVRASRMALLH